MDIDPEDAQRVAEAVERISYVVELIERRIATVLDDVKDIDKTVDDTVKHAEKGAEKAKKGVYGVRQEVDRIFEQVKRQDLTRIVFGPFDRKLEEAKVRLSRWQTEVQRQFEARGAIMGGTEKMLGLNAAGGGIKSLIGQLTAGMPFGGLLGLALWGGLRQEVFDSGARKAVYQLRALGETGKEQVGAVSAQMKRFYSAFGDEGLEMVGTASKAFTDLGISGTIQIEKASVSAKGFGSSIRDVSLAVDAMTGSSWGTTAKLIGETLQTTTAGAKDATDQILELTDRLRQLGLNFGIYSAGITQATASLRLHNQSGRDTAQIFTTLYAKLRNQGFDPQRAGSMALERMQGAAQGLKSMPEGLQALLAQDFAKKGMQGFGGMKDPFALLTRFRLGQEGKGDLNFMSESFANLRTRAFGMAGTAGTPEEQRLRAVGALARVGGMDEKSAAAIIDSAGSAEETEKILAGMKPAGEKTNDLLTDLNKAFGDYKSRQSKFETTIRDVQVTLASMANNLLGMLSNIANQFINFVRVLPLMLRDVMPGAEDLTGPEREILFQYTQASEEATQKMMASQDAFINQIPGLGERLKELIGTVMTRGPAQAAFEKAIRDAKPKRDDTKEGAEQWYKEHLEKETDRVARERGHIYTDRLGLEHVMPLSKDREDAANNLARQKILPPSTIYVTPKPTEGANASELLKAAGDILKNAGEKFQRAEDRARGLTGAEPMIS